MSSWQMTHNWVFSRQKVLNAQMQASHLNSKSYKRVCGDRFFCSHQYFEQNLIGLPAKDAKTGDYNNQAGVLHILLPHLQQKSLVNIIELVDFYCDEIIYKSWQFQSWLAGISIFFSKNTFFSLWNPIFGNWVSHRNANIVFIEKSELFLKRLD